MNTGSSQTSHKKIMEFQVASQKKIFKLKKRLEAEYKIIQKAGTWEERPYFPLELIEELEMECNILLVDDELSDALVRGILIGITEDYSIKKN